MIRRLCFQPPTTFANNSSAAATSLLFLSSSSSSSSSSCTSSSFPLENIDDSKIDEDEKIDLFMSNSRELKGMPDLAEKRWNAKFLAQSAEDMRKQQQPHHHKKENDIKQSSSSSSTSNAKNVFLDHKGDPLHPELERSLKINLEKHLKQNQQQSASESPHYSGSKWYTKQQVLAKGYHLKNDSVPIFAINFEKRLQLINVELFVNRKELIEPELIHQLLPAEKQSSNRPYWLHFESSGKSLNAKPKWQTTNTKILIQELLDAQIGLNSGSCLWIERDVAEKMSLKWKTDVVKKLMSTGLSQTTRKQLGLEKFDESTSCLLFEPRMTEAFFNEKQVVVPF